MSLPLLISYQATGTLILISLFAVALLMAFLAVYAFTRPRLQTYTRTYGWLCVAIATYALFYAMGLASPTHEWALVWNRIEYLGISALPAMAIIFGLQYTQQGHWLRGRRIWLPWIIPLITFTARLFDHHLGMVYASAESSRAFGLLILEITPGPWYWLHVAYINLVLILAVLLVIRYYRRASAPFRSQVLLILLAMLAPWAGHLIYQAGGGYAGLDISPFAFGVFGVLMAFGIFRLGLMDLTPIAREYIFEGMRDAVIVMDDKQRILDLNPAAESLFGKLSPTARDKHMRTFFKKYPKVIAFLQSGQTSAEISIEQPVGTRHYTIQQTHLYDKRRNPQGSFISLLDITTIKQSEQALRTAKQQADEANRAKSEFLANMSHEIRTPMNAILGFAEALMDRLEKPEHQQMIRSVASSGNLLLSLLNEILDLSKIEAGRLELDPRPVDMVAVMEEVGWLFKEKASARGLRLTTQKSRGFPARLVLDETRIRQILFNLVGNAVKFTHRGSISVHFAFAPDKGHTTDKEPTPDKGHTTDKEPTPDKGHTADKEPTPDDGHKPGKEHKGELRITVKDTGIGIPADQLEIIFEPFFQQKGQSDREYGGTGLGLPICKRLAERMNGRIGVESTPGKGSAFTLVLPGLEYTDTATEPMAAGRKWEGRPKHPQPPPLLPQGLNIHVAPAQRLLNKELLDALKGPYMDEWRQLKDHLVIFKIEGFARKLQEEAARHNNVFLKTYSERLSYELDRLDIEGVQLTLHAFPEWVRTLENTLKEPSK